MKEAFEDTDRQYAMHRCRAREMEMKRSGRETCFPASRASMICSEEHADTYSTVGERRRTLCTHLTCPVALSELI